MPTKNLNINIHQRGAQKAEKQMQALGSSIAGTIGKYAALSVAVTKAVGFLKESIEAYERQELAEKKLATALGHTSQFLLKRASALQKVTTYGDEQIIEAQALIAAFVKEEDAINAATKATLDLAAGQGMDLMAASALVAKTLGSTTNALSRYGIEVSGAAGSTERLKTLVENTGRVFGGQAQAQAEVLSGKIKQLSNSYGDLQESVAAFLVDTVDLPDILDGTKEAIEQINEAVSEGGFAGFLEKIGELGQSPALQGFSVVLSEIFGDAEEKSEEAAGKFKKNINQNIAAVTKLKSAYQEYAEKRREVLAQQEQEAEFAARFTRELMIQQGVWRDINLTVKDTILPMVKTGKPLEIIDVTALKAADGYINSVADSIAVKYQNIAGMVQNLMGSAFTAAFTEGESVAEAFFNSLKRMILNLATQTMVFGILSAILPGFGSLVGGIGGFLGFRQHGGPVERGRPYVVGERGPEIIIPRDNATVVPNDRIGTSVNITFTGPVTDKQFVDSYIIPRIKKAVRLGKV